MTKDQILGRVSELYNKAINQYGEDRLVGAFAVGNINYNLAQSLDEVNIVVYYIPTFEQLCTMMKFKEDNIDNKILVRDIRSIYSLMSIHSHLLMQSLLTDYYILNVKYEIPILEMRQKAEWIFKYNQQSRIYHAAIVAEQMLRKYGETNNALYLCNAARLQIAIDLYKNGASCYSSVKLEQKYHIDYLLSIKYKNYQPDLASLTKYFGQIIQKKVYQYSNDNEPTCFVKKNLLEIGRIAMANGQNALKILETLTQVQRRALMYIANEIHCLEGNISISRAIREAQISRPTFTSLLDKLQNNRLIEVENQGVKGLYIKICDGTLRKAMQELI